MAGNKYDGFSIEKLEEIVEILAKTRKDPDNTLMINEGNGWVRFEDSEAGKKVILEDLKRNYKTK